MTLSRLTSNLAVIEEVSEEDSWAVFPQPRQDGRVAAEESARAATAVFITGLGGSQGSAKSNGTGLTIAENGFRNFKKLQYVLLPSTLKTVEKNAFSGCDALIAVLYEGTREAWKQIDIQTGNEHTLLAAKLFYEADKADLANEELPRDSFASDEKGNLVLCGYNAEFQYTFDKASESYTATGLNETSDTTLELPPFYNLLPVTAIGPDLLQGNSTAESLLIPYTVTKLDTSSFSRSALKCIYYEGTDDEAQTVTVWGSETYAVTVHNGTGGGSYTTGAEGLAFIIGSANSAAATFIMPAKNVTLTAYSFALTAKREVL